MNEEEKSKFKSVKLVIFFLIVFLIARVTIVITSNGGISSLEGYLYSFAAALSATPTNATSSDVLLDCATSSNATSSNASNNCATSSNVTNSEVLNNCATSSNVTSGTISNNCATSSNTTSINKGTTDVTSVGNTENSETTEEDTITVESDTIIIENEDVEREPEIEIGKELDSINVNKVQEKNVVQFLETHKTYIMIIALCVMAIIVVAIIIFINQKNNKEIK